MTDGRYLAAVLLAVTLCGCAVAPDIRRRIDDEARLAARREMAPAPVVSASGRSAEAGDPLTAAIRADHQVRMALAECEMAAIQGREARRLPWPRLIAEGVVEFPVEHGEMKTEAAGGLYLRLDPVRAFLYKNAVTAAEVSREARRELCLHAASEAARSFLVSAIRLEADGRARERNEAALRIAARAADEAAALIGAGHLSPGGGAVWERRRLEREIERHRLDVRLELDRAELARFRRPGWGEAEIIQVSTGLLERLAIAAGNDVAEPAWLVENAHAVVQAKLELFQAEMGILEAKLKRLPTVSLGLGLGEIPITADGDDDRHGGLVPMLGVSLPIFDMGDISRGIGRARIRAAQARERLALAVEGTHRDWRRARGEWEAAGAALRRLEAYRGEALERGDEAEARVRSGAVPVMDGHEAAWLRNETDALADQYRTDWRLAVLAERAACGKVLDDERRKAITSWTETQPP